MTDNLSGEFILKQEATDLGTGTKTSPTSTSLRKHHHSKYPGIRKNSLGFITSLCIDPENVSIVSQDDDEDIHILVRRHHITNIPWFLLVVFLLFVPLFAGFIFAPIPALAPSVSTSFIFLILYYLSLFGYALLKFSEWYFHVGLMTNKRLVDIDMHSILSKNVAETEIAAVEDVTYVQKGILQSVFNYGTVSIQTEAIEANFEFDKIPRPSQVAEIVNELASAAREAAAGGGE